MKARMTPQTRRTAPILLSLLAASLCLPALAHPEAAHAAAMAASSLGAGAGAAHVASVAGAAGVAAPAAAPAGWLAMFQTGFAHPFSGFDHLLAMLSVGIWSARQQQGGTLPLVFLGAMLLGALSGVAGATIPGLEAGMAATVVLAGALVAVAARLPLAAGAALIAVFAVLHGNAHGHELPAAGSAFGFLAASGLLMLAGRWFGRAAEGGLVRITGAGIAATGVLMLAA
ncbi:HupE/UreJ family protein [Massilia sp. Root418]|uniref:HupE/UreJ family protein n=1 Tax=Massilia sp. Root418 TaxID=1736532 RepID=UPI000A54ED57|nr:HupE/UreJ family protein [Massilia sp. Root418]